MTDLTEGEGLTVVYRLAFEMPAEYREDMRRRYRRQLLDKLADRVCDGKHYMIRFTESERAVPREFGYGMEIGPHTEVRMYVDVWPVGYREELGSSAVPVDGCERY